MVNHPNRAKPKWQPIETAPKGKPNEAPICVLLSWTYAGGLRAVGEGYWHADDEQWWWANTSPGDYYSSPIIDSITGQITHWMPLPSPPSP